MNTQNTATPWNFFWAVEEFFGIKFKYDMAASSYNYKCESYFTEQDDSLKIDWPRGEWCWLNPQFKYLTLWLRKCDKEFHKGSKIISIWPLSSDLNQIPSWIFADMFIIHGRVWPCVRGCVVCRWTPLPLRKPITMGLDWDREKGKLTEIWSR